MGTIKQGRLSQETVDKYTENWMKMLPGQDSNMFVAYDNKSGETERVTSFKLEEAALKNIKEITKKNNVEHFGVYLGATDDSFIDLKRIPDNPYFIPILGVKLEGIPDTIFYKFSWEANPPFLDVKGDHIKHYSVTSGIDAISPRNAYLFMKSWMDRPFGELGRAFVGTANGLLQRVRHYRYITAESEEMVKSITIADQVYMHIGDGGVNPEHPFAFRPIIETVWKSDGTLAAEAGGSAFDFSSPCPPICYP